MTDKIDTPFTPQNHIDEWGFVWEEKGGEFCVGGWHLCRIMLDDITDELTVRVWNEDYSDGFIDMTESSMVGQPYLPLIWPKADPGAGLEVTMRVRGGASVTHTITTPGSNAEKIKESVAAALLPKRPANARRVNDDD